MESLSRADRKADGQLA